MLILVYLQYVTGSAKRGLMADPNSTYSESCNFTYEFGTALKLGPNVPLTQHICLVGYEGDSFKT